MHAYFTPSCDYHVRLLMQIICFMYLFILSEKENLCAWVYEFRFATLCLLINATLLSDNHEMRQCIVTFSISSSCKNSAATQNYLCLFFFKLKRQNKSLPAAKREPLY